MKKETSEGSKSLKSFKLRKWQESDAESLVRHANNEKIANNLRDGFPHPYTMADAISWIEMVMKNKQDIIYAIEVDGEACGGIGLHGGKDIYRFNAEIGYWLSEKYWGNGIISRAVDMLIEEGFRTKNWIRIYAGIFHTNKASLKVLQKCGFSREAIFSKSIMKNGVFLDEHVYSIFKK